MSDIFFVDDIILQNILLQNMGDFGIGGGGGLRGSEFEWIV